MVAVRELSTQSGRSAFEPQAALIGKLQASFFDNAARSPDLVPQRRELLLHDPQTPRIFMTKLLSALLLTAFAFSAQAASHAGGAPMKADAAKPAASAPKKADAAKAATAAPKKAEAAKPAASAPKK